MSEQEVIIQKLGSIEKMLFEQNLLQKEVLNFNEACSFLDVSASHLYKLTSKKEVPHFCPNGKKLYFKRIELDSWLQRNRQLTSVEVEENASDLILRKKGK